MKRTKRQMKAMEALNLDLFQPDRVQLPSPATLYTRIKQYSEPSPEAVGLQEPSLEFGKKTALPPVEELRRLFDRYNWMYFGGKLPSVKIEYSARMTSAGSYSPNRKLIRIGRKYHQVFPEELGDTLKHEMLHILYPNHDSYFKREAARIGASVKARSHPSLRKPPRYLYYCPSCGAEYPRQKRLRMASCGSCSPGGRYDERYKLKLKESLQKSSGRRQ